MTVFSVLLSNTKTQEKRKEKRRPHEELNPDLQESALLAQNRNLVVYPLAYGGNVACKNRPSFK